jgi:hypothetical protein
MKRARLEGMATSIIGLEEGAPLDLLLHGDQDACLLRSYEWHIHRDRVGNMSVVRYTGESTSLSLGAQIMRPPEGSVVWHFNGDDSDFRRQNLRVSTRRDRNAVIALATPAP